MSFVTTAQGVVHEDGSQSFTLHYADGTETRLERVFVTEVTYHTPQPAPPAARPVKLDITRRGHDNNSLVVTYLDADVETEPEQDEGLVSNDELERTIAQMRRGD